MSPRQFLLSISACLLLCLLAFLLLQEQKPEIKHQELFELALGSSYAVHYGDDEQFDRQFYVGADTSTITIRNLNPNLTTVKIIDDHIREFTHGQAVRVKMQRCSLIVVWVYDNQTHTELGRWNITIDRR